MRGFPVHGEKQKNENDRKKGGKKGKKDSCSEELMLFALLCAIKLIISSLKL